MLSAFLAFCKNKNWVLVLIVLFAGFGAMQTVRLQAAQDHARAMSEQRRADAVRVEGLQKQLMSAEERINGLLAEHEVMLAQMRALDDENADIKKALQGVLDNDEAAKEWSIVPVPAGIGRVLNRS